MEIVLVHPEIPHNTGCAARLSAATGVRLHLVEPLGFSLEDRYLKRAGLDYWPMVDLHLHASWAAAVDAFSHATERPLAERLKFFTARGGRSLFETKFAADDLLVFGSESRGLPADLLAEYAGRRVYIPIKSGIRSLNLANTVCLSLYTAMVRAGVPLPDNDGAYDPHPLASVDIRPGSRVQRVDDRVLDVRGGSTRDDAFTGDSSSIADVALAAETAGTRNHVPGVEGMASRANRVDG